MGFADDLIAFAFVVLVPLVLVAGGLVSLFAVGALFRALDDPKGWQELLHGIFRTPLRPPKPPGPDHYYKPFWVER